MFKLVKIFLKNKIHSFGMGTSILIKMTSDVRVGRGSKIAPKMVHYRVGQGRSKMAKKHRTSLMDVPYWLLNMMGKITVLKIKLFFPKYIYSEVSIIRP